MLTKNQIEFLQRICQQYSLKVLYLEDDSRFRMVSGVWLDNPESNRYRMHFLRFGANVTEENAPYVDNIDPSRIWIVSSRLQILPED